MQVRVFILTLLVLSQPFAANAMGLQAYGGGDPVAAEQGHCDGGHGEHGGHDDLGEGNFNSDADRHDHMAGDEPCGSGCDLCAACAAGCAMSMSFAVPPLPVYRAPPGATAPPSGTRDLLYRPPIVS